MSKAAQRRCAPPGCHAAPTSSTPPRAGRSSATRRPRPRILASNTKLFTTAAALARFGVDGRLATEVRGGASSTATAPGAAPVPRGRRRPDLRQPPLRAPRLRRRRRGRGRWRALLERAGIRRVSGRIIGDESRLRHPPRRPRLRLPDLALRAARSAALAYNRGLATESGRGFQSNPPAFAAARLDSALAKRRHRRARRPARRHAPAGATELAAVESPTMARLAALTNKPSDNFFAEMLLKALGRQVGDAAPPAAAPRWRRAFARGSAAAAAGWPTARASRAATAPRRTAWSAAAGHAQRATSATAFYASLSIAGRDGTLRPRMRRGPARGRCRAKTGTISGVSAAVGLLPRPLGRDVRVLVPDERRERLRRPRRSRTGWLAGDRAATALAR